MNTAISTKSARHYLQLIAFLMLSVMAIGTALARDGDVFDPYHLRRALVLGKTTEQDVLRMFGKPTKRASDMKHAGKGKPPIVEVRYEYNGAQMNQGGGTSYASIKQKVRKGVPNRLWSKLASKAGFGEVDSALSEADSIVNGSQDSGGIRGGFTKIFFHDGVVYDYSSSDIKGGGYSD